MTTFGEKPVTGINKPPTVGIDVGVGLRLVGGSSGGGAVGVLVGVLVGVKVLVGGSLTIAFDVLVGV